MPHQKTLVNQWVSDSATKSRIQPLKMTWQPEPGVCFGENAFVHGVWSL